MISRGTQKTQEVMKSRAYVTLIKEEDHHLLNGGRKKKTWRSFDILKRKENERAHEEGS